MRSARRAFVALVYSRVAWPLSMRGKEIAGEGIDDQRGMRGPLHEVNACIEERGLGGQKQPSLAVALPQPVHAGLDDRSPAMPCHSCACVACAYTRAHMFHTCAAATPTQYHTTAHPKRNPP